MRLVIVESPYAGDVERNVAYARAAVRDCLLRGEAPMASHLLYTQEGILRDKVPGERAHGIEAGLAWGRVAEATVVYADLGISDGMTEGMARARAERRPVETRSLPEWRMNAGANRGGDAASAGDAGHRVVAKPTDSNPDAAEVVAAFFAEKEGR